MRSKQMTLWTKAKTYFKVNNYEFLAHEDTDRFQFTADKLGMVTYPLQSWITRMMCVCVGGGVL